MSALADFFGMKIIENSNLTIAGDPVDVERTWKERLLSRPWKPWKKTKVMIPRIPDPTIYQTDGVMMMHPDIAKQIREKLKVRYSSTIKVPGY